MVKKITKTQKLKKMKNIDGQDDFAKITSPAPKIRSIDELFGFHGATYKTYSTEEYTTSLASMNIIELQDECWRVGLQPNENRRIMEERLRKQHARVTASINNTAVPVKVQVDAIGRAILAEGANRASR